LHDPVPMEAADSEGRQHEIRRTSHLRYHVKQYIHVNRGLPISWELRTVRPTPVALSSEGGPRRLLGRLGQGFGKGRVYQHALDDVLHP
jgi:hypothetical protein